MEEIRSIANKAELKGTAYIELLPGKYKGHCWNEGSLFFEEEVFGYFEPIIEMHARDFDHYAFTEVSSTQCFAISDALKSLGTGVSAANGMQELPSQLGFIFHGAEERFDKHFDANARALATLATELASWLVDQATTHDCVTILGL
jgi:hypothetical protein